MLRLFRLLGEKPWEPVADPAERAIIAAAGSRGGHATFLQAPASLALKFFLAVVTVLFSLFAVVYFERMEIPDWKPLAEPGLLWLNTGLLILGSIGLEAARMAARRGQMDLARNGFLAGGAGTIAFLVGQLAASQQLIELGYFASTNPSVAFFFLLTGLHAAHLLGGLVAWVRTLAKMWRGETAVKISFSIELCAVYWHYLLLVWLCLFGLLLLT